MHSYLKALAVKKNQDVRLIVAANYIYTYQAIKVIQKYHPVNRILSSSLITTFNGDIQTKHPSCQDTNAI